MDIDVGKYYYLTSLNKAEELPNLVRKRKDGTYQSYDEKFESQCFKLEENIKNDYVAVAPQFVAFLISWDKAPIYHHLSVLFEKYDVEDDRNPFRVANLDVLYGMRWIIHDPVVGIDYPDPKLALSRLTDEEFEEANEKGCKILQSYCGYYNDTVDTIMDNTIYQEYHSFKDLIRERDYSRQFDPYKEHMMMNEDQARLALKDHFGYSIGMVLSGYNVMSLESRYIEALRDFVRTKSIDSLHKEVVLKRILSFDLKSFDEAIIGGAFYDPVFRQSLMLFPYSLKTDLKKVKTDNPSYNIVMVRDEFGKVYVVMFRRQPIKCRQAAETGFSHDELARLLK